MAVLLSGGGDVEHYYQLDQKLRRIVKAGSALLLVPVANDPDEYPDVLERVKETLGGKQFSRIEMVDHLREVEDLSAYSAIYLDGGNTFALLEEIRSSAFTEQVKAFVKGGGHVYGDSAGAIVFGADISTAYIGSDGDDNIAHLQAFHGLGLIDSWSVHCHYEAEEDGEVQDLVYNTGSPIIAISEETGAFISEDGMIEAFGARALALFSFTGKVSLAPGERCNLNSVLD